MDKTLNRRTNAELLHACIGSCASSGPDNSRPGGETLADKKKCANRITADMGFMKFAILFFLAALPVLAQTNVGGFTNRTGAISNSPPEKFQSQTNLDPSIVERVEQMRAACINGRRSICGRVLQILPDGLVVESGYTNLLRSPLNRSWLVPGTVTASRAPNLVEGNEPGAICVGLVVLTNLPKSRRAKAKAYDYVIIEAYPAGPYTYTSVGSLQRTVRRFSTSLEAAVKLNLQGDEHKMPAHDVEVK
jgi:hypothetical protein